ncbi:MULTISPECIES: type III secretion system export apparatus subunit SctT [Proteus]|uniref:type III secretion system export apparatus subunit SctT n=1 Tax=Proteus TaxID=583 RepID=UPI00137776CC|nr:MULTISPECIES: type III secretion system export apparatus subunit SctT [Proteus]MCX2589246.1 type III secretion system export apparatus subunit SctT [Proteus penneri]NBL77643.1 EscT/YscT/HrcT family type III secretion system export apparatus protein [Proteus sp. G2672]NBL89651.1 EscT/YscT/HrcT family type III secretion system export apparatus protein [Proteus sp. G2673]NBM01965.1 EscT/YscT/HrcT family type III secretion system export apparatus protein [Proteus sp. G2671]NBM49424.1 EscT/YscT/
MSILFGYLQVYLVDLLLLVARLFPVFMFIPFLNSRVLNSQLLKYIIVFYVAMGIKASIPITDNIRDSWGIILISELVIGILIGMLIATPFWIASAFGEFIDNQRGASIGDTINPTTGIESSEFASLTGLFCVAYFMNTGGLIILMDTLKDSYDVFPIGYFNQNIGYSFIGKWLTEMVRVAIVLVSPVLIIMFLSEVALGVYSLFCPQLNAFSLSLCIKGIIAFSALLLFFSSALTNELSEFFNNRYFYELFMRIYHG